MTRAMNFQPDQDEGKLSELMVESSHPELYRNNAFRITGLSVDASPRDIARQADKIKMAETLKSNVRYGGAMQLDPPPDADSVRMAMQRLRDPESRLIDEFFWFWPHQLGQAKSDEALVALHSGDISRAASVWTKQENDHSEANVSTHNLAVLAHATALDLEHRVALKPGEEALRDLRWKEAIKRWKDLVDHEAFWSRLTARIRDLDDPRLTTGVARRIRSSLSVSILSINAQLALKAAEKARVQDVRRHLRIMHRWVQQDELQSDAQKRNKPLCPVCKSAVEKDQRKGRWWCAKCGKHVEVISAGEEVGEVIAPIVEQSLLRVLRPICQRVKLACKTANEESNVHPAEGDKIAERLLSHTQPLLDIVGYLLPTGNPVRDGAHDEVAMCGLGCQIVYGNKTENWKKSLTILEKFAKIASGESVRIRIGENLAIVRSNYEYGLCWFCGERKGDDDSTVETKMHGEVDRTGYNIQWRYLTVKVPRCRECRSNHAASENFPIWGVAVGGGLGVAGCSVIGDGVGFAVFLLLGIVGGIVGNTMAKNKSLTTKALSTKNEFRSIKDLLSRGWSFGEKPPGVT